MQLMGDLTERAAVSEQSRLGCIALIFVVATILIAGCASQSSRQTERETLATRVPGLNEQLFGPPRPVPEFADLVTLTPEQQTQFLRFFRSGVKLRIEPNKRLYAYLTSELSDINFRNRTLPASTAIQSHSGNCMSLALVTTAYARLANIETGWQLAETDPVYSSEGSIIYSANHIQTRLYHSNSDGAAATFSLGRPYLLVDYFTDTPPRNGRVLRKKEVIALVYQNLGAEAMADGRLKDAYWLLRAGLMHDPTDYNLYNALAVLLRRAGDAQTAEKLYRFALDEFGDRLIVLRNYRELLLTQSRAEEADRLEPRIMALPDPDPYPLIRLGDEAADRGDTHLALQYYRKAGDVAPYLHEIYLKIARIHAERGDLRRAERTLRKARDRAQGTRDRQMYEAKLAALETH